MTAKRFRLREEQRSCLTSWQNEWESALANSTQHDIMFSVRLEQ